jgi:hypothetical protein
MCPLRSLRLLLPFPTVYHWSHSWCWVWSVWYSLGVCGISNRYTKETFCHSAPGFQFASSKKNPPAAPQPSSSNHTTPQKLLPSSVMIQFLFHLKKNGSFLLSYVCSWCLLFSWPEFSKNGIILPVIFYYLVFKFYNVTRKYLSWFV